MNDFPERLKTAEFAKKMKEQRDAYYEKNPQLLDGRMWKDEKKDAADLWLEANDPFMKKELPL